MSTALSLLGGSASSGRRSTIVSTRNIVAYQGNAQQATVSAAGEVRTYRIKQRTKTDVEGWLYALFPNFYADNAGFNTVTLRGSFEYPLGTIYPWTFTNGQDSISVQSNRTVQTYPVTMSIPKNTDFYIRMEFTFANATDKLPIALLFGTNEGQATGSFAHSGGTFSGGTLLPCPFVIGTSVDPTYKSCVALGDSIVQGANDFADQGFVFRYCDVNGHGYANLSRGGQNYGDIISVDTMRRRWTFLDHANPNFAFLGTGSNDCNGAFTVAAIQNNIRTICSRLKARGIKTFVTTVPPRTAGGTSVNYGTLRTGINDWLVGITPAERELYGIAGVIRINEAIPTWNTANSDDGIHPTTAGHNLITTWMNANTKPIIATL